MVPVYAVESWLALRFKSQVGLIILPQCWLSRRTRSCVNPKEKRGRRSSLTGTWVVVLTWQALWLETMRESYEAYVIYAFFKVRVQSSMNMSSPIVQLIRAITCA
jgi:hypothetical protein